MEVIVSLISSRYMFNESSVRFHRSITRPFFTRDHVTDFDNFDKHAQHALKMAKARLTEGHSIDFQVCVLTEAHNR